MKEWILNNLDAVSIAGVVSSVASVALAIIGLLKSRKSKKRYEELVRDIKARTTWTICPKCGKKVYFAEFSWNLLDGQKDDNLNGVPDDQE